MQVEIDEMQSTVHATDSTARMDRTDIQRIVNAVIAELSQRQASEQNLRRDRRLAQGASDQRRGDSRP